MLLFTLSPCSLNDDGTYKVICLDIDDPRDCNEFVLNSLLSMYLFQFYYDIEEYSGPKFDVLPWVASSEIWEYGLWTLPRRFLTKPSEVLTDIHRLRQQIKRYDDRLEFEYLYEFIERPSGDRALLDDSSPRSFYAFYSPFLNEMEKVCHRAQKEQHLLLAAYL